MLSTGYCTTAVVKCQLVQAESVIQFLLFSIRLCIPQFCIMKIKFMSKNGHTHVFEYKLFIHERSPFIFHCLVVYLTSSSTKILLPRCETFSVNYWQSRLPVVLDIVGGHDGMIHWVENDRIHIHSDWITGQDLWVVSYENINTLPLAATSLDSTWILQ